MELRFLYFRLQNDKGQRIKQQQLAAAVNSESQTVKIEII